MDNSLLKPEQPFMDSREYGGFLYLTPTFQCLNKLVLPAQPYVFGVLLQKWEVPWAKVFPLRLLLRLGAEFRCKLAKLPTSHYQITRAYKRCVANNFALFVSDYPCPLVSMRRRRAVFGEIGHTIMNLLVDFRHFRYQIAHVRGASIYMRDKTTYVNLPRNRYEDVSRAKQCDFCILFTLVVHVHALVQFVYISVKM